MCVQGEVVGLRNRIFLTVLNLVLVRFEASGWSARISALEIGDIDEAN